MKATTIVLGLAAAVFTAALSAEVVFVSSVKATMHSENSAGSGAIATLMKGSKLTVVGIDSGWLKVRFGAKQGWVKKMFTSAREPGDKVSILSSAKQNARVHARQRSSSDVTAASARGLDDDSAAAGRNRAISASAKFDPQAIEKLESITISETELMAFLKEGGLQ